MLPDSPQTLQMFNSCVHCFSLCVIGSPALPKFHTHPASMSVDEGGVARFQCQINGVPEARITWEKDRVLLNTTDSR